MFIKMYTHPRASPGDITVSGRCKEMTQGGGYAQMTAAEIITE